MYKVLAAMRIDMNEGWVWMSNHNFSPRSIVKIRNKSNKSVIYCEALEIDDNFIKEYNQLPRLDIKKDENTIVINGWYRSQLGGIETKKNHSLEISFANGLWGKFCASIGHPQLIVRLATWLGIISIVLGTISIVMAFQ